MEWFTLLETITVVLCLNAGGIKFVEYENLRCGHCIHGPLSCLYALPPKLSQHSPTDAV